MRAAVTQTEVNLLSSQIDRVVGPFGHDTDESNVYLVAHIVPHLRFTIFAGSGRFCLVLGIGINGSCSKDAANCHQCGMAGALTSGHCSPQSKFTSLWK